MVKSFHKKNLAILLVTVFLVLTSCTGKSNPTIVPAMTQEQTPTTTSTHVPTTGEMEATATPEGKIEESSTEEEEIGEEKPIVADVVSVKVSGSAQQYQFSIGISSPDTGCEQYADWWEILSEDGELIYRRILLHSHVKEQPFTRSGGPVDIGADTVVIIRAHMNQAGYSDSTMKGTVDTGFEITDLPLDFAPGVENETPLPAGCNF